jgi:hypothetical protein
MLLTQLPILWPLQHQLTLSLPGTLAHTRRTASSVQIPKMTIPPTANIIPPLVRSLTSWTQRRHVQSLRASAKQRPTCPTMTVVSPVATRNQRPNQRKLWPNPTRLPCVNAQRPFLTSLPSSANPCPRTEQRKLATKRHDASRQLVT